MKVLSFDKIAGAGITSLQCYDWASESITHKADAILPAKISLKPDIPGVFYNTMPCIVPTSKWGGRKACNQIPGETAQPGQYYSSV